MRGSCRAAALLTLTSCGGAERSTGEAEPVATIEIAPVRAEYLPAAREVEMACYRVERGSAGATPGFAVRDLACVWTDRRWTRALCSFALARIPAELGSGRRAEAHVERLAEDDWSAARADLVHGTAAGGAPAPLWHATAPCGGPPPQP